MSHLLPTQRELPPLEIKIGVFREWLLHKADPLLT
jgi:hypothetical protein